MIYVEQKTVQGKSDHKHKGNADEKWKNRYLRHICKPLSTNSKKCLNTLS